MDNVLFFAFAGWIVALLALIYVFLVSQRLKAHEIFSEMQVSLLNETIRTSTSPNTVKKIMQADMTDCMTLLIRHLAKDHPYNTLEKIHELAGWPPPKKEKEEGSKVDAAEAEPNPIQSHHPNPYQPPS